MWLRIEDDESGTLGLPAFRVSIRDELGLHGILDEDWSCGCSFDIGKLSLPLDV